MKTILLIGFGGFLGSIARYIGTLYGNRYFAIEGFPVGTFLVNVLGCLLIGLIYGCATKYDWFSPELRFFAATGFCGGFTTFSTFSFESLNLLQEGQYTYLFLYIFLSLFIGIAFALLGFKLVV